MKELELRNLIESDNYSISSCGRVFSLKRKGSKGGELTPFIVNGYKKVSLWINGKLKVKSVHKAVCEAYIANTDNKPFVNHIDGNKLNNNASNLEWVTAKENSQHAYDNYLSKSASKGRFGYNSFRGKEVFQYDYEGCFVKSFGSTRDAERQTGVRSSSISLCINNKLKTAGGYLWKLKKN